MLMPLGRKKNQVGVSPSLVPSCPLLGKPSVGPRQMPCRYQLLVLALLG
jgi:hypothetical protein